ncbi:hypothetical protein [Shewanella algidipiscicola]|uniref:hypothetical protein n=1 Tax=Shewanella algidipiscicola TaxID=614070 RepID=UPI001EF49555|nr:hypothetical protein [Shewanella algidipiscicola]
MSEQFICWRCKQPLTAVILPMSRREECLACHADQHVCKMCVSFGDAGRGDCNEVRAEWISDRERANFCDYFKPITASDAEQSTAQSDSDNAKARAQAQLAALFNDEPVATQPDAISEYSPAHTSERKPQDKPLSAVELAEQQLRELLGD